MIYIFFKSSVRVINFIFKNDTSISRRLEIDFGQVLFDDILISVGNSILISDRSKILFELLLNSHIGN